MKSYFFFLLVVVVVVVVFWIRKLSLHCRQCFYLRAKITEMCKIA